MYTHVYRVCIYRVCIFRVCIYIKYVNPFSKEAKNNFQRVTSPESVCISFK